MSKLITPTVQHGPRLKVLKPDKITITSSMSIQDIYLDMLELKAHSCIKQLTEANEYAEFQLARLACEAGHEHLLKLLIKIDPSCIGAINHTPLLLAAANGHTTITTLITNIDNKSVLANNYIAVKAAASNNHIETFKQLISCDRRALSHDNYAILREAAKKDHSDIVNFIVAELNNLHTSHQLIQIRRNVQARLYNLKEDDVSAHNEISAIIFDLLKLMNA